VFKLEPNDEWTVEQVLQWHLLQSHLATDQKHEELVSSLQRQFEQGKEELCQVLSEQSENVRVVAPGAGTESAAPSSSKHVSSSNSHKGVGSMIHIQIIAGPHAGKTIVLQPKPNAPCVVGRSAGKKFRERGVSLAKDSEVSTTHGKFEIIGGKVYFTDVGSTNGTTCKNQMLATNSPFLLEDNVELVLGGSTLRVILS
jgi:FHA domain